ncbi:MAG: acyl-CoA dehydrogenase family protein [Ilumatobacteraceae bacterium]
MKRTLFEETHELFRESVSAFVQREVLPNVERWEQAGIVDRQLFATAGKHGFFGVDVPEELGGGGVRDFRYNMVFGEELVYAGAAGVALGLTLHNDICMPYFTHLTSPEQQRRWLPAICRGELITAVAMTEPGAGSDLASITTSATRDGDEYVVNGSKTFITNGINADLVVVAVRTDPTDRHGGLSLLVVERDMPGFERGRNLSKVGLHSQDTAELYFSDVRVPVANRLGEEGHGFKMLMRNLAQERLSIAVTGVAAARAALGWTVAHVKERRAFGQPLLALQNTRFTLAEMATEVEVAQAFVDRCVEALNSGELEPETAAMAKWWCTELQGRVVDAGVQLHGGYGYMLEYPIARAYADARVTRIFGGATEVMKEIIARGLER